MLTFDRAAVIGDPHLTHKSLDKILQLFAWIEALNVLFVIWLGDLLDTKEIVRGKCLNAYFEYFKASNKTHIIIIGNHDWFNLECNDHALRTLSSLPNVIIVDIPMIINNILFMPFLKDTAKIKEEFKKYQTDTLFGHLDVKTFDFGNGTLSEEGLELKDLKQFKTVISGHYHKYQSKKNLTYLGTPFSHSFGEADQEKYIGIFDVATNSLELLPSPFPRHVSLDLKMGKFKESELQEFLAANENNIKRIRLFGTTEECSNFNKVEYIKLGIKIEDKSEGDFNAEVNLDETIDNKTQFTRWATDIKKLDTETMNLGLSILEAVSAK